MKILVENPGRLVDADDPDRVAATVVGANPLHPGWDSSAVVGIASPDRPLILWSGSCGADLFEPHPHNWGAPGGEALARLCAVLSPQLEARDAVACFRPHARHVLSDAPSCRRFQREHGGGSFGLALAPALLLEPSMLGEIEDHLTRIFEALAGETRFLCLSDVVADGDGCRPVPLGSGVLPRAHVLDLVRTHVAPGTPIVLMDQDLAAQRAWLGVD